MTRTTTMMVAGWLACGSAWADDDGRYTDDDWDETTRTEQRARQILRWELTTLFTADTFDFSAVPLRASDASSGALTPFEASGDGEFTALGAHLGARTVIYGMRTGAAVRLPVPVYGLSDGLASGALVDASPIVDDRVTTIHSMRFELGYEPGWKQVSPYVDLVGTYHWLIADLTVGGVPTKYTGETFAYGVQGGLRMRTSPCTEIVAGAELGLTGTSTWGAHLGVSWSFGLHEGDLD